MFELLSQAGIVSLLSMVVGVLPLGAGISYLLRPTEQRLALMRPMSLAGIFGGSTGLLAGLINGLRVVATRETPVPMPLLAWWIAESLVPLFVAFACLTVGWLCAAVGLRRHA